MAGRTRRTPSATALRRFVRAQGPGYLADPNVTSIGIGYKITGGRRTRTVSVQFTVAEKLPVPELEAVGGAALPGSVTVDGVEVPTDVLKRSYVPSFRLVAPEAVVARKTRTDPVAPGVSVANVHVSAGTLGAIVHDRVDGTPYVLSNWHVLHGPDGAIGDVVVQPGPHDDNRTDANRLGTLVRSHLGIAGDCAIASITDRRAVPAVLELDVTPTELGDPELDDHVVKSGRTTGVTYGIVRRVDTIAKLHYGGRAGLQTIGCVEIGPDPDRPAANRQVSMGGDSGSLWLAADGDAALPVVAGLHFGGEGTGDPDDHALACLPASVFEKLEIALRPPEPEDLAPAGFDDRFLGTLVPPPEAPAEIVALARDGSTVVDHTHFSVQLHRTRRFALWVAWNLDGGGLRTLPRTGQRFRADPRYDPAQQVGDELYVRNPLDRGHLARRADLLWGPPGVAEAANADSFLFSNITPQLEDFNQSARRGVWGRLEEAVLADADVEDLRLSVLAGPVLAADDRPYRGVLLPREYWKVLAYRIGGELRVKAFLLTQDPDRLEALDLDEFRVWEVPLADLESRTALTFADPLHAAAGPRPETAPGPGPLETTEEISW